MGMLLRRGCGYVARRSVMKDDVTWAFPNLFLFVNVSFFKSDNTFCPARLLLFSSTVFLHNYIRLRARIAQWV